MNFEDKDLLEKLENVPEERLDQLDFGVIGFSGDMKVTKYNKHESDFSGLGRDFVLDKHFFIDVAPCMNNFLVALKFEEQEQLDEIIDYVLTFRMAPTYVKLRLLKDTNFDTYYILVKAK